MRLSKANTAGLTSPGQQSEMKSILAGTWPPLKPLPVFKYETVAYRATIEFDRKRGEWVCRKTSLPSNKIQELRGGLREITMALPHGEEEMLIEDAEQQEQELENDTNRRLQAIHDWRENYKNGARFFELRNCLSESQRNEMDDSLRLSLTARQLQFNSKNLASVFDDLSVAGGRFATLIEFAKRNKAKQETDPQAQGEGAEFPEVSIKDLSPEQEKASLAEQMAHTADRPFEIETPEVVDASSPSLVEHAHQEARHSSAFTGFAAQVRPDPSSAARIEGLSSRFPALEISTFQVAVFASLFLLAVIAFNVGLRVGRSPLGRRLREDPKSLFAMDAKSPTPPNQADKSTSPTPTPPVASSDDSAGINRPADAAPSEEKPTASEERPNESPRISNSAEARSTDADSSPAIEPKPTPKPEVNPAPSGAIGPVARNVSPPAISKFAHSHRAAGAIRSAPRSPAPFRLTSTIGAAPRLPRSSTVLVTVPDRGNQPFRVSFPKKTIAATSSCAMTSELSVLIFPEPGPAVAHQSARLEAGELVSFVWPRYPRLGDRYRMAETIRVRAMIGQLGQVLEVKFLSGSASLRPATMEAIRQWRYTPTLLDKRPVQAEQDVTIEFRPPQPPLYSSQVSTQHPSHN